MISHGGRAIAWAFLATCFVPPTGGVLRYPDGSFESRSPLHVDECGGPPLVPDSHTRECLLRLRAHLLEDADCNRVICDNIYTSTPVEFYANQSDWAPFKNLCGNLRELFLGIFDLGVELLGRPAIAQDKQQLLELLGIFGSAYDGWANSPDDEGAPAYANTTRSVLQRHGTLFLRSVDSERHLKANSLLELAVAAARRLQLLIENVSVTLLLNFFVAQLEKEGRTDHGRNFVHELYGDVNSVRTVFHEVPGKRWDTLSHLLEQLGISDLRNITMAEVGVEAANTSQRLLERNPSLSYVGVDPYTNNDGLYEDVVRRLTSYRESERFTLHRTTSLAAAELVLDNSLDLVFLDARHDYEAVALDMQAWRPKVRAGGVLSGHDFSWMFPTVGMAVYRATFDTPERTLHLAPDGVWWFQL